MNRILGLILLLVSLEVRSQEKCNTIYEQDHAQSVIYVICDEIVAKTTEQAKALVVAIFQQYNGPPDETIIYFITSASYFGLYEFPPNVLSGRYYTHDNQLVIWPMVEKNKRTIALYE